eukprot:scaffold28921_cov191-Amphora_coffeaeformis.AAC.10
MTKKQAAAKPKAIKAKASSVAKKGPKGDTVEIIRSYLFTMREMGINQVAEQDVLHKTGYARTDSVGYRKAMGKLTKALQHVTKSKGIVSLTPGGLTYLAQHGVQVKVTPPTMEEHQEKLLQMVLSNANAPEKNILALWKLLLDGRIHAVSEMVKVAGYQRTDSKGYRQMMSYLKKLELVEKKGDDFCFTDNVYRHGSRPMDI